VSGTPFDLIIFGGGGDLSLRKLVPALFHLYCERQLPAGWRTVAVGRAQRSREEYLEMVRHRMADNGTASEMLERHFDQFAEHIDYQSLDVGEFADVKRMGGMLREDVVRIFYLALHSDLYRDLTAHLRDAGLTGPNTRVVLEKPIGMDRESAAEINHAIGDCFEEHQIYRIDHYLGKETVQNLLVLRFANTIFETQWNQKYIDHVQITIAESIGVEGRAGFYDGVGALRDMVQNHLLQLLCMVAMEPPSHLHPDALRDEKVKVLRSLHGMTDSGVEERVVFGQYRAGICGGRPVTGYLDESGVAPDSRTESYVALRVDIDNWRWAGVPFYLRTGKRLSEKACEIAVHFKSVPHSIFDVGPRAGMSNRLVFRLQPDEGVTLSLFEKRGGPGMNLRPAELSLNPDRARRQRTPDAYERLLSDVLDGNQTLFVRADELMTAWDWLDPVLEYRRRADLQPDGYTAGTWGPPEATLLLARDGRLWDEPYGER